MAGFWNSLLVRLRTAGYLVPATIILVILGNYFLLAGLLIIIFLASREFLMLLERKGTEVFNLTIIVPPLLVPLFTYGGIPLPLVFGISILFIFVAVIIRSELDHFLERITIPFFVLFYLGLLPTTLLAVRQLGLYHALFPILITWVSDTGAYLVGVAIGMHKVASTLSPKKTWEGVAGGVLSSVGAVFLFTAIFPFDIYGGKLLALGITIPFVSLIGDLFESGLKREVGLKDTSDILPGHGGFLDRIDSLLFVIPYFYLYYQYIVR
ncbi:MAG TPA: hypothetical protein EYP58_04895 [bacterium (Candidatus Stahlbacteria)]|nr:hypothetical protein [Candidatus Stahlbacteria bacterium]